MTAKVLHMPTRVDLPSDCEETEAAQRTARYDNARANVWAQVMLVGTACAIALMTGATVGYGLYLLVRSVAGIFG